MLRVEMSEMNALPTKNTKVIVTKMEKRKDFVTIPVIAASYLGPAMKINQDAEWSESLMPSSTDNLVLEIMGQPMRRAGRFIKMACCGALACLKSIPPEDLKDRKIGIFLATGLGNIDEVLPFIKQVFKHDGGFPSPNQFANSVSNAAAFFLAQMCEVKGVVLTISQEELSFESAIWLAQSYLESGEIDLAMVGGCDVFTPTFDDYRERLNLTSDNARPLPLGEGSSWLMIGNGGRKKLGDILAVEINEDKLLFSGISASEKIEKSCTDFLSRISESTGISMNNITPRLLSGFRIPDLDAEYWRHRNWIIEDYLPHCGIHSTAAAFGLARALLGPANMLYVHYNCHASGKRAMVAAVKKP